MCGVAVGLDDDALITPEEINFPGLDSRVHLWCRKLVPPTEGEETLLQMGADWDSVAGRGFAGVEPGAVNDDQLPGAPPSRARDGHVHARPFSPRQPPEQSRASVAQYGARLATQDGGQVTTMLGKASMADGIDATVHPM